MNLTKLLANLSFGGRPSPESVADSLRKAIGGAEESLSAAGAAASDASEGKNSPRYQTLHAAAGSSRSAHAGSAAQHLDRVSSQIRNLKATLMGSPSSAASASSPAVSPRENGESLGPNTAVSNGAAGQGKSSPVTDEYAAFSKLACTGDLLMLLAGHLRVMGFEARKDAVLCFNNLLKSQCDEGTAIERVCANDGEILKALLNSYDTHEIALNCGSMLRECLKHEAPTSLILHDEFFWRFFDLVSVNDFDVASDAFASFKELLTRHQDIAAEFVDQNYDKFFQLYNKLLLSDNYVTRRQSLKLLGEMLLERANFSIMTQFIASSDNLKLVMNLLLDNRKNIQYEAFHIFKIFVANPNKPASVKTILVKNKEKMMAYLSDFLTDRDDEQFQEDRQIILEQIQELE